ncbi:uncharacterized protein LOC128679764 isoform X1 [Plodia interpunctella]|uniref:uncharacterized protein LOC128679764 isoform X1 n=1 Tax=Plodia interpunctella TaxID=58824 RepID=UPI002367E455|nr:uncharacterized protein LOC128679764 isoform X1 [Plodia interpunctella]
MKYSIAIIFTCLTVKVTSLLEISTVESKKRSQADSRDYISAFLRSDIRKLETVLQKLPKCEYVTQVGDQYDSGYALRANINCKRKRRAFEGLLNIFKKLDVNYEAYMDVGFNTSIGNRQKKYKIVTRPTEPTRQVANTPSNGPGVIKYVLCFIQSTRIFKSCIGKTKGIGKQQTRDSSSVEHESGDLSRGKLSDAISDDEGQSRVQRARYQLKFRKVTRAPDYETARVGSKSKELMSCIHSAYGVFQTCAVPRKREKKKSSEENGDRTYRADDQQQEDQQEINTGQQEINTGQHEINTGQQISTGQQDITGQQIYTGQQEINTGQHEINNGQQISTGQQEITGQQIYTGQQEMNTGQQELNTGQQELNTGQQELNTGQQELNTGQQELNTGQQISTGQQEITGQQIYTGQQEITGQQIYTGQQEITGQQIYTGQQEINTGHQEIKLDQQESNIEQEEKLHWPATN